MELYNNFVDVFLEAKLLITSCLTIAVIFFLYFFRIRRCSRVNNIKLDVTEPSKVRDDGFYCFYLKDGTCKSGFRKDKES